MQRRIDAEPDTVWSVLTDVENWPSWTASVRSVQRRDAGPLRAGSAALVRQPGLRPQVWRVTELAERACFTWQARGRGLTTTGYHLLATDGDAVLATIGIRQHGPLAGVVGALFGARIRRFVTLEAEGLRRAAEAG